MVGNRVPSLSSKSFCIRLSPSIFTNFKISNSGVDSPLG